MADRQVRLHLLFPGEPPTTVLATVHDWTPLERARRTVSGLAFMWLLAGISLPFPPIHWVLVPAFLLAGPVLAVLRATESTRLLSLHGACPRCKVERDYTLGLRYSKKRTFPCDGCGNLIALEEA